MEENQHRSASKIRKQKLVFYFDSEFQHIEEDLVPGTSSGPKVNPNTDTVIPTKKFLIEMFKIDQKFYLNLSSDKSKRQFLNQKTKFLTLSRPKTTREKIVQPLHVHASTLRTTL